MEHYDLAVVGSGAGLMVIEAALQKGKKCALVEKGKFGGTCLTRGCIPSKILVYPADLIRAAEKAAQIGLDFARPQIDWSLISQRMWQYIDHSKEMENSLLEVKQLAVYRGTAAFTGPDSLHVPDEKDGKTAPFTADMIVLAAGARTSIPPIPGLAETGYVSSETFFGPDFPSQPWSSLAIIGAGAVGLEFAHIFSAQGTQVSIIEMADRLAPAEEPEISQMLADRMRSNGVNILAGHKVAAVRKTAAGKELVLQDQAGRTKTITSQEILLAAGVRSNADLLVVEKAGLATDSQGYIITNEYLETNRKNIWAIGDINGKFLFRHKANLEAEILAHNLLRPDHSKRQINYRSVPWAIFTDPQIAHLGMTEEQVKKQGIPYQIAINRYSSIAKGYAMGYAEDDADDGFVKLITSKDQKLLGAHIIGPEAAILIQPFVYLLNQAVGDTAGSLDPIRRSMVIHPALSELTAWAIEDLT